MKAITVEELQRDPLTCLRRVEEGETLLVVRDERPIAEIKPALARPQGLRPYGLCVGEFAVPADFDQPLPENVLQGFEGA